MGTQRKSVDMHGIRTAKASNAAALLGEGLQRRRIVWQWMSFGEQGEQRSGYAKNWHAMAWHSDERQR